MRRESKSTTGSVVKDRRSKQWQFFWWADGKRHSKTLGRFPTKTAAWNAAQQFRIQPPQPQPSSVVPTVAELVEQYKVEKMPTRFSTRRSYDAWLTNHIVPKWGACALSAVQARPVELWLQPLTLAPKSKAHLRGMLRILWDFAMWRGDVPTQRNPMELVTVKNASQRVSKPHSLTVEEFQRFIIHLREPFRTMALLCVCCGLRISECFALRWSDVDWLNGKLTVERGIVRQHVDAVKTAGSRKQMTVDGGLLEVLKQWKQTTQFSEPGDWIFASPVQLGRLPWSYPLVLRVFGQAAKDAGIAHVSTHTMRHSYRAWLDAVGTSGSCATKANAPCIHYNHDEHYGDVVTDEMAVQRQGGGAGT